MNKHLFFLVVCLPIVFSLSCEDETNGTYDTWTGTYVMVSIERKNCFDAGQNVDYILSCNEETCTTLTLENDNSYTLLKRIMNVETKDEGMYQFAGNYLEIYKGGIDCGGGEYVFDITTGTLSISEINSISGCKITSTYIKI